MKIKLYLNHNKETGQYIIYAYKCKTPHNKPQNIYITSTYNKEEATQIINELHGKTWQQLQQYKNRRRQRKRR